MTMTRRNFLRASLMAGGLVAVPQFGRWFRSPTGIYLYGDGRHDDTVALQRLCGGGYTLRHDSPYSGWVERGVGGWGIEGGYYRLSGPLRLSSEVTHCHITGNWFLLQGTETRPLDRRSTVA